MSPISPFESVTGLPGPNCLLLGTPPPILCKQVPLIHGLREGVQLQVPLSKELGCRVLLGNDLRGLLGAICVLCFALRY